MFTGNGSPAAGWPDKSTFLSFDALWNLHESNFNKCPGQTPEETAQLRQAILAVDKETGYNDAAGILTQVVQESGGCVRIESTRGQYTNPGLLQSCDGKHTCAGQAQCPYATIEAMIRDGVAPNEKKSDLVDARQIAGGSDAMTMYRAARIYNSGMQSIVPAADGHLWREGMLGIRCYASDYANIRIGWVGLSCGGQ